MIWLHLSCLAYGCSSMFQVFTQKYNFNYYKASCLAAHRTHEREMGTLFYSWFIVVFNFPCLFLGYLPSLLVMVFSMLVMFYYQEKAPLFWAKETRLWRNLRLYKVLFLCLIDQSKFKLTLTLFNPLCSLLIRDTILNNLLHFSTTKSSCLDPGTSDYCKTNHNLSRSHRQHMDPTPPHLCFLPIAKDHWRAAWLLQS